MFGVVIVEGIFTFGYKDTISLTLSVRLV